MILWIEMGVKLLSEVLVYDSGDIDVFICNASTGASFIHSSPYPEEKECVLVCFLPLSCPFK